MGKNKKNSAEKESASEKTSVNEVCGILFVLIHKSCVSGLMPIHVCF